MADEAKVETGAQTETAETTAQKAATPEYVTADRFKSLEDKLDAILQAAQAGGDDNEIDPTDQAAIDARYAELTAGEKSAAETAAEDPVQKALKSIEQRQARVEQLLSEDYKERKRNEINARMTAKHPDWADLQDVIWKKVAVQYPNADEETAYLLAKAMSGKTVPAARKEPTPEETERLKKEVANASRSKPGSAGTDAARTPRTLREAIEMGLDEADKGAA